MHLARLLFLLPFSATSTLATPVGDDPSFPSDSTLFPISLDIDLSKDSTNRPPPEAASSKSASQLVATNHDPQDLPSQDYSKESVDLPQKSTGDFSNTPPANLLSTNSLPTPPLDEDPRFPPVPPEDGPDCKGWKRLCCFGDLYYDDEGHMSVDQCFPYFKWFLCEHLEIVYCCLLYYPLRFEGENCYSPRPADIFLAGVSAAKSPSLSAHG